MNWDERGRLWIAELDESKWAMASPFNFPRERFVRSALDAIHDPLPPFDTLEPRPLDCPIQQGLADGLLVAEIGTLPFAHHQAYVDEIVTVPDAAIIPADLYTRTEPWYRDPMVPEINAWLTIGPDDTVTIRIGQVDLGTGVMYNHH